MGACLPFPGGVQDCPVWVLMLESMLLGLWGKSQEKQVEQLTIGGQRWAGDCQPGLEFPWPL